MRISDWSSDVCSSDLHLQIVRAEAALREKLGGMAYRFHTVHDRHDSCGEEHLVRPDDDGLFVAGDKHLSIVCAVDEGTEGRTDIACKSERQDGCALCRCERLV